MIDRTKPYNQLPLLPPPSEAIDAEVFKRWGLASRALAEFNRNILRLPNPDMLVNTISIQEAKSSSEIENIFTTEDELFKAISTSVEESNASPATKEVLRYREALWAGFERIKKSPQVDLNLIINVCQQVKDTSLGIRPPQSLVTIKRGESELRPGEIIYTPPRGKGVLEPLLTNLIEFMNTDSEMDPLIKMAIAHYQFEAIHPFSDGNGRTGRILNLLYLIQSGLLTHPALYMSSYIIQNKDDYYYHLGAVTQRGNWKDWLLFMMTAVERTAIISNQMVDEILDQMEATFQVGKENLKWYTKEVNECLFHQPYVRPENIGEALGRTSRTTLTKYMGQLCELGILSAKQSGKQVYYHNNDLLRIISKE